MFIDCIQRHLFLQLGVGCCCLSGLTEGPWFWAYTQESGLVYHLSDLRVPDKRITTQWDPIKKTQHSPLPLTLPLQNKGQMDKEDHEGAGSASISALSKKWSARWRPSMSPEDNEGNHKPFKTKICSFLSWICTKYLEELSTFCGEFHRNWKLSGKIRTKENRNSWDPGDRQWQPCHSATANHRPESFTAWWRLNWAENPCLLTARIIS